MNIDQAIGAVWTLLCVILGGLVVLLWQFYREDPPENDEGGENWDIFEGGGPDLWDWRSFDEKKKISV